MTLISLVIYYFYLFLILEFKTPSKNKMGFKKKKIFYYIKMFFKKYLKTKNHINFIYIYKLPLSIYL